MKLKNIFKQYISVCLVAMLTVVISTFNLANAQTSSPTVLNLPVAGQMLTSSPIVQPAIIRGINIHPSNPFRLDFIIDKGDTGLTDSAFEKESSKLIKYFLAALTVPEEQMWVNLSPYEKDRIVPDVFGRTEMGRDLLAQDYLLKQFTASLMYPEDELGAKFWKKVQAKAMEAGIVDLPYNTFNKVWIVPEEAVVYEHERGAFVVSSHLKVMLEDDYIALEANKNSFKHGLGNVNEADLKPLTGVMADIVREVILPEIEHEVNNGELFSNLRQIYNAVILANWYKQSLRASVLGQIYADQERTSGIEVSDPEINQKIYQQYLDAFEKGVYDYIKEEYDPNSQQLVGRKYISGGADFAMLGDEVAETLRGPQIDISIALRNVVDPAMVTVDLDGIMPSAFRVDAAMLGQTPELGMTSETLANNIQVFLDGGEAFIPKVFTVSDQHGTIDKFDDLLLHMFQSVIHPVGVHNIAKLDPDRSLEEQFNEVGASLDDFKGSMFIHNIGDFMDRGPYGIKVYRRSKELIDVGLSDFIIGNHDQWMFMNLTAFHLPWYDNFEFYGYKDDYDGEHGNVRLLVEQAHKDTKDTRDRAWWAEKLAEFVDFHNGQQETKWKTIDDEVNSKGGLFEKITNGMEKDDIRDWFDTEQGRVWAKLKGFDVNVGNVYTGVRAVGQVSIVWWQQLLEDFKRVKLEGESGANPSIQQDSAKQEAWQSAVNMIENHVIPELKKELDKRLQDGQWYWRVFEAINSQNYTSPEWWSKDWVFHKGWGSSVLKELNESLAAGEDEVTTANYLNNPILQEIAQFYKQQYSLHERDILQSDYMHAFLPVDQQTGEFYFNYKGKFYRGKGTKDAEPYWVGLAKIKDDVRAAPDNLNDPGLIPAIYPAMSLVNSWYADTTTVAKVSHVAQALNGVGTRKVARANNINRLTIGHLPMHDFWKKLTEDKRGKINSFRVSTENDRRQFVWSDHGMGQRFGGGGKYISQDEKGLRLIGYTHKNSLGIIENPNTVIFEEDGSERTVTENSPVQSELFLTTVRDNIIEEMEAASEGADDKAMLGVDPVGGIDLNAVMINMEVQRNGDGVMIPVGEFSQDIDIQGFVPVIINIVPINNLLMIIGLEANLEQPDRISYRNSFRFESYTAHLN